MTRILVTTANGDTGRPMVEYLLERGLQVRAMVRRDDARAQRLRDSGAEVVFGDLLNLRDVRAALDGVQRAYFNFPVGEGLVEAAVMFAQAAREHNLELIVNMSHIQSRPQAHSKATQNHWLAEQIFDWSAVPTTTLRVTFFMEWLTYIAGLIRCGRYVLPYDADSRFAPIAARDIALTAATILSDPEQHGGHTYTLTGPVEYSHQELAAEVSRVLARNLPYERVTATTFLDLLGIPDDTAKLRHFEAVTIDQREGRLAGVSDAAPTIIQRPLATVEDFINENRSMFYDARKALL
ncbi:NmrA family transcriptional regulator [Mycobacterium intermedium]|uniref:NmrA family transcriptional regulator n=1 Tax=Mycobacterium intermedium TaxID=28445 RepID=A0A1E3SFY3_MYCIE|nr:NmrA family NAD(P)-binding protein [Mycobacterium intermedium]MCV6963687.1 NmrA family NAD(P)-binding protein [Mycobacterium intermedium]ODR01057.1 NmrA family transcriptional regulator [Mycobacterium intermedium]OPE52426.1 NmrA family transcriptional regulator [Mycobacterium intermedium]ORB10472.1 NmrA family transcriptional regulator [Mycobacterium intermedium]